MRHQGRIWVEFAHPSCENLVWTVIDDRKTGERKLLKTKEVGRRAVMVFAGGEGGWGAVVLVLVMAMAMVASGPSVRVTLLSQSPGTP